MFWSKLCVYDGLKELPFPKSKKEDIKVSISRGRDCWIASVSGKYMDDDLSYMFVIPSKYDIRKCEAKFLNGVLSIEFPIAKDFEDFTVEVK